jgi:electron transport complex protein RnfG
MKEIIKMIVVLSLLCGASGLGLSYLKISTAPLIEQQVLTYVQGPALKGVFSDAENDPIADRKKFASDGSEVTVFPAIKGGKLVGVALESFAAGYGGDIGVMVGIDTATGNLAGIGITTLKETPGLGMRTTEPAYTNQFKGLTPDQAKLASSGGKIDTISSAATVNAVAQAVKTYQSLKDKILAAW